VATLVSAILTQARRHLSEGTATFWSDAELTDIANRGIRDLWRRIVDLYDEHFVTVDDTNVTIAASTSVLAGVPSDVYRVVAVEPRVVGQNNPNPGLIFKPRKYNHPDFVKARAMSPAEPNNLVLFYTLMNAGAPVGAPSIFFAPQLSSGVNLRLVYNQTLSDVTTGSNNPIPGESDNAVMAWIIAYARAKERDDRAPDPEWVAIYGTEKTNLITQLGPRSIQEPEVVEGMFEDMWPDWL
jgi:hypothetical protein